MRKSEIDELESLDRVLLRKILALPKTTPSEALYLETGCVNIETIIKSRRVNFLHYLLKSDENSMLNQFFHTQHKFPIKDDWTLQVSQDLKDLDIPENFKVIKSKSKESFKKLVKKKVREFAFNTFIKQKEGHSKLENLEYKELKPQDYLMSKEISVEQAQILLKFRTRMAKYGKNYKGTHKTHLCQLCWKHPDSQDKIFECEFNKQHLFSNGKYEELFYNNISVELIRTLEKIYKLRENKLG